MARARLIHPEFSRHEGLAELAPVHRLLFALLPTIADREGLLEDRPRRIKADLFPYDTDLGADVGTGLAELARIGCIQRVELYGRKVITIPGFLRWNKPHPREKQSELSKPGALPKQEGAPKASPGTTLGGKSPPVSVSVPVSDPVPVSTTSAQSAEKAQPPAPETDFQKFVFESWPDVKDLPGFEARAREANPGIDLLAEAKKARGWELSDPKRVKRNHGKFLWGWLSRAQDSASRGLFKPRTPALQISEQSKSQAATPGRKFV